MRTPKVHLNIISVFLPFCFCITVVVDVILIIQARELLHSQLTSYKWQSLSLKLPTHIFYFKKQRDKIKMKNERHKRTE